VPLVARPLVDVGEFVGADQMACGESVGLHLVLRPVVRVREHRVTEFVREHVPLGAGPQSRVDDDRVVLWQPQPVRGS